MLLIIFVVFGFIVFGIFEKDYGIIPVALFAGGVASLILYGVFGYFMHSYSGTTGTVDEKFEITHVTYYDHDQEITYAAKNANGASQRYDWYDRGDTDYAVSKDGKSYMVQHCEYGNWGRWWQYPLAFKTDDRENANCGLGTATFYLDQKTYDRILG